MDESRKKPGWAFWTTVVLIGVPALYVATFGPACWIEDRTKWPSRQALSKIYAPVLKPLFSKRIPRPVTHAAEWYADVGAIRELRLLRLYMTMRIQDAKRDAFDW